MLDFLLEELGIHLNKIRLIQTVVLEALNRQIIDVSMWICLILAWDLRLLLRVVEVIYAIQRVAGTLLDILRDLLADRPNTAQLGLVGSLALEDFLEEYLQTLHGDGLKVGVGGEAMETSEGLLSIGLLVRWRNSFEFHF